MPASKNLHNSAFSCPRFPPYEAFGRRPRAQSRAPAKGRPPKPFSIADVAERRFGRLKRAESTPTGCALGRTGVRAKAAIPLRARMGFAARRRIPWRTYAVAFGLCLRFNGPSSSSISQRDGGLHSDLQRIGEGALRTFKQSLGTNEISPVACTRRKLDRSSRSSLQ